MIKQILGQGSFIMINKEIMKKVGFDSALLLSILADAESLYGEEFSQTVEQLNHFSCGYLTKRKQSDAIKKLEDSGMIQCKLKGVPPVRHFKINTEAVITAIGGE